MDTRQRKKEVYHFIIIVPHRDSLKPFEEYRAKLFASGFPGAFSFPTAAPLASVSRAFSVDELKELGRNIRELTNKSNGKIFCSGNTITKFTTEVTEEYTEKNFTTNHTNKETTNSFLRNAHEQKKKTTEGTEEERRRPRTGARGHGEKKEEEDLLFYGVPLNLPIEETLFPQTARKKILGIFSPPVLCAALLAPDEKPPSEEGPVISFRAASLANLAMRPLESGAVAYSFEWKIGPPVWLPKYKGGL